ncbi:PEP/pyruvate-binding domain-containing protein [Geodermatophilus sp. SYSU D00758]
MTTTAPVLHLSEVGRRDVALVGGKGASLGELLRAGISVPTGFTVTTAAFRRTVADLTVDGEPVPARVAALDPADAEGLAAATARIRQAVEAAPLAAEVADAIAAGYAALGEERGQPDLPVAVRSSATSEDSAEASFAGLQDTYLWVRGAASVVEHVRRCWASLYSVESVTYRLHRGIPEIDLGMAVVVQRMVGARSSGVMFTRSPLSGDRSVVSIDASWGLGSAVVSGDVTPDSFVVSKVTGEVGKRTVAHKTRWHRPDPSGAGVVEDDVPEELRDRPSVSDEEIAHLVATARRVEAHYGRPQDIEWAIAEDGGVFLLQSRPETVWAEKDAGRAATPVAAPAERAYDHVFNLLGGRKPPAKG